MSQCLLAPARRVAQRIEKRRIWHPPPLAACPYCRPGPIEIVPLQAYRGELFVETGVIRLQGYRLPQGFLRLGVLLQRIERRCKVHPSRHKGCVYGDSLLQARQRFPRAARLDQESAQACMRLHIPRIDAQRGPPARRSFRAAPRREKRPSQSALRAIVAGRKRDRLPKGGNGRRVVAARRLSAAQHDMGFCHARCALEQGLRFADRIVDSARDQEFIRAEQPPHKEGILRPARDVRQEIFHGRVVV